MEVDYELSQQLAGHESQVRCVAILSDAVFATGGLDGQVILWKRVSDNWQFAQSKRLSHHSDFVYALAPSLVEAGAFYSCSKDRTAFRLDAEGNPVAQYVGHDGPVCSVAERGEEVVTGAWDGTCRIWSRTGELRHTLDAGAHAVAVAVLPSGEVVTGSQDRSLRVFRGTDCVQRVNEAHSDIIRCIFAAATHVLTASNDNLVKMWSFDGCEMARLAGHQSFVYSVCQSPDNQYVLSSSDDCTLKLWRTSDLQCRQTVIHAGTVWQSAALPNGDLVTCCADGTVRVWTSNPARMASEAERQAQREVAEQAALKAVQKGSSSVPMESATDIALMPSTHGKKNGEIRCFKDGASVFAFSWNAGARVWDKIGEVVGQQEEKKFFQGDSVFPRGEYDFVFDVDMGPAMGTRLLPYSRGQNPMQVAEAFCAREQIHKGNIEQIRQFIVQNSGGSGVSGDASAPAPVAQPAASGFTCVVFPIMTASTFKDGKFDALLNKLLEFNDQVETASRLDSEELGFLKDAIAKLKVGVSTELRACEKDVLHSKLKEWPRDKLFPVIDLWRLFLVHPHSADLFKGSDRGTTFIVQAVGLLSSDAGSAVALCSARFLANLFIFQTNRYAALDRRDLLLKGVEAALLSSNKHTRVACCAVLLNLAIVLHESSAPPKPWDAAAAAQLAALALRFLQEAPTPEDAEGQQRCLLALGTLLPRDRQRASGGPSGGPVGGPVAALCREAGLPGRLAAFEGRVAAGALAELRALLAP